jgi:hypothetical protein
MIGTLNTCARARQPDMRQLALCQCEIDQSVDVNRVAERTAPGTPHKTDHNVSDASTVTSCMSNFSPNRTGSITFPTNPCKQPGRKKARKPGTLSMQPRVRYVDPCYTATRMRHHERRSWQVSSNYTTHSVISG